MRVLVQVEVVAERVADVPTEALQLGGHDLADEGLGGLGGQLAQRHPAQRDCERQSEAAARVWNEETQRSVHDRFTRTEVGNAEEAFSRLVPWVDRYTGQWTELRHGSCIAAQVEHERPEQYVLVADCLDDRLIEFEAFVESLRVLLQLERV